MLLGTFTSDHLELRQGSDSTYFISTQQVMEKVSIKRTKLLLGLNVNIDSLGTLSGHSCDKCGFLLSEEVCNVIDNLPDLEHRLSADTFASLVYIAGYVIRKDERQDDTYFLFEKHGSFITDVNRGGLTIPGDSVCQWVIFSYIVFHEVASYTCRTSLANVLMVVSELYSFGMNRSHALTLCNIFFNNYCHLYSPRSGKEPSQEILKLSV